MIRILILFLPFLILRSDNLIAGKEEFPVPAAVRDSFRMRYPSVTYIDWEEEDSLWEAEFKLNGAEVEAIFTVQGKWIMECREIQEKDLPAGVSAQLQNVYPKAVIREAEKCSHVKYGTCYQIEFRSGRKKHECLISEEKGILEML